MKYLRLSLPALLLSVCLPLARAADWWVSPGGVDDPGRGTTVAPLRTLAYACTRATAGDVIRLTAGTFPEVAQSVPASGVTIVGMGRDGASASVVRAPAAWDFSAAGWEDDEAGYVLRLDGVRDCRVEGIRFEGNDHRANGAILCTDAADVEVREVDIVDFRFTGAAFRDSERVTFAHARVTDSGFEKGPDPAARFPDGGSAGNVSVHDVTDSHFHHVDIATTDHHGYGLKMAGLERCAFHDLTFDLYGFQSWRGVGRGNFDVEIHGGRVRETAIYNSRFTQIVSVVAGSGVHYDDVDYTLHLHHNHFALYQSYGIELVTDKMVIDHNYFGGTWGAAQSFANYTGRVRGITFAYNVCTDLNSRVVGMKGDADDVRVFNNTIYYRGDAWQKYALTIGEQNGSENWAIANNILRARDSDAPGALIGAYETTAPPRFVDVVHNLHPGIPAEVVVDGAAADPRTHGHVYADNAAVDPALPLAGAFPREAYYPGPASPAVDAGDSGYGITADFVGAARDIGAYERGEEAWAFGPGATWDVEYVWAPRSSVSESFFSESVTVDLFTDQPDVQIRYTLDGSEPGPASPLYTAPLVITDDVTLKAKGFRGRWMSLTAYVKRFRRGVEGCTNVGRAGTSSASSEFSPGYGPSRAFDGDRKNWLGWSHGEDDDPHWLQVDLGSPHRIDYVALYARSEVGDREDDRNRRNFEIRASNDPTFGTYAVLAAQGTPGLPFAGVFVAEPADGGAYRYVRAAKTVAGEAFFVTEFEVRSCGGGGASALVEPEAAGRVLYPNPARDYVSFEIERSGAVYDLLGARVLTFDRVRHLDLDLPPATYVVRFGDGGAERLVVR